MSRSENKNNIPRAYAEWNNLTLRFIQFARQKKQLFYVKRHFYFLFFALQL